MRTVKEVAKITGISVRTLHYYDEIGLLKPTQISGGGYRLYDDKALETLQQILFFKEFDMPLKAVKAVLDNPDFDRNRLLTGQKELLVLKKERLERIIASIDDILKGDNQMNFEVFSQADIEQLYHTVVNHMSEDQKKIIAEEFGCIEKFEKHFLESASSEKAQKNYAKIVEWYGNKESAMEAASNSNNSQIMEAYAKRFDKVLKKLAAKTGADTASFEVKELVGELDFVGKQLYQMKDLTTFMLDLAEKYRTSPDMQERLDAIYGEGSTVFIGKALEAFYKRLPAKPVQHID